MKFFNKYEIEYLNIFWNLKGGIYINNKFFPEKTTTLDEIALDV